MDRNMWIKTTQIKLCMQFLLLIFSMAGAFSLLFAMFSPTILVAQASSSSSWSTYLGDLGRTGFDKTETILNPSSVKNLYEHWQFTTGGPLSAQPVINHGRVLFGSWDGNEYATDLNGNKLWSQYLGQTTVKNCEAGTTGVASTATVADISINGKPQGVVFVGGGNAVFYALNAKNGKILWHTTLGPSPATFIWASPAYYKGSIYIGVASFGDCPLVQGQLVQLNATTGAVQNTFNTVPNGCTGNGVWGSPTIDQSTGDLYIVTGNGGSCSQKETYAISILEFNTANFSLVGYWPVPASQLGFDQDFGSTPTLFKATIKGVVTKMVGVVNKNGTYYAFKRTNISAGPVWQVSIGVGGDCPLCGTAQIAPAAWDGKNLYVASEHTTINGTSCLGSIRQLDPATGKFLWQDCLNDGSVLAAVSAIPGVIFVAAGGDLLAVSATNGSILKTLTDSNSGSLYFGPASIANGVVYIGNVDDVLHAYGV
jgi:outer membrane protein assembly factor BamB